MADEEQPVSVEQDPVVDEEQQQEEEAAVVDETAEEPVVEEEPAADLIQAEEEEVVALGDELAAVEAEPIAEQPEPVVEPVVAVEDHAEPVVELAVAVEPVVEDHAEPEEHAEPVAQPTVVVVEEEAVEPAPAAAPVEQAIVVVDDATAASSSSSSSSSAAATVESSDNQATIAEAATSAPAEERGEEGEEEETDSTPAAAEANYPRHGWGAQLVSYGPTSAQTIRVIETLPVKPPSRVGDIVVEVTASSVNPVDWKIGHGYMETMMPSLPSGLGFDYCGTVVFANRTKRLKVGDRVFGMGSFSREDVGSFAQYVRSNEVNAVLAPDNLSDIEAASLPLVSLTSYQALKTGKIAQGHKVLILGGSSGTGAAGIQIAKALGAASVVVTCSGSKAEFCTGLGADRVVDYRTADWRTELRGEDFDLIYDCVGGEESWIAASESDHHLLKPAGWFVTIAGDKQEKFDIGKMISTVFTVAGRKFLSLFPNNPNYSFITCDATFRDLQAIHDMIVAGHLRPTIDTVFPLGQIWDALLFSETQRATGKICIDCRGPVVPNPPSPTETSAAAAAPSSSSSSSSPEEDSSSSSAPAQEEESAQAEQAEQE